MAVMKSSSPSATLFLIHIFSTQHKGIAGNQGGRRVAGVIQQHAHHLNKTVFRIADPPDAVILTFGLNGQIPGGIRCV